MSGWDYWKSLSGSIEAASAQASKLAEVVTAQVTEQSRNIAAQATTYSAVAAQRASDYSKVAAENAASATSEARAQLASLHLPEALANLHLPSGQGDDAADPAALERFCVTPDLCTFVRSMTYATFRDFPPEEIDKPAEQAQGEEAEEGAKDATCAPLNPWQANHAKLVCSSVREINELRFVLVPKIMDDAQFWAIYFTLNHSRLPPECYEISLQVDELPVKLDPPSQPRPRLNLAAPEALKKEFRDFKLTPAARDSDDREGLAEAGEGAASGWLRNLLNGFDMEVPTGDRLEQDTVVLGALHSRMHKLTEGAKGIRLPDDLKDNIAANINNVRDLLGMPHATPQNDNPSGPSDTSQRGGNSREDGSFTAGDTIGSLPNDAISSPFEAHSGSTAGQQQQQQLGAEVSDHQEDDIGSHVSVALDTDPDLEAYLREVEGPTSNTSGSRSRVESDAGDFDKYLEEFATADGNGGGNGDGGDDQHSRSRGSAKNGAASSEGDDYEDLNEYLGAITDAEHDRKSAA